MEGGLRKKCEIKSYGQRVDCEKMCEIKRVIQRVECENKTVRALSGGRSVDCKKMRN